MLNSELLRSFGKCSVISLYGAFVKMYFHPQKLDVTIFIEITSRACYSRPHPITLSQASLCVPVSELYKSQEQVFCLHACAQYKEVKVKKKKKTTRLQKASFRKNEA